MKASISFFTFDPRYLTAQDEYQFLPQKFASTKTGLRHVRGIGAVKNKRNPEWPGWHMSSWHALAQNQASFEQRPVLRWGEASYQMQVTRTYSFDEQYLSAFDISLRTDERARPRTATANELCEACYSLFSEPVRYSIGPRANLYKSPAIDAASIAAALHFFASSETKVVKRWLAGSQFKPMFASRPATPEPPVRLVRLHPIIAVLDDQGATSLGDSGRRVSPKLEIAALPAERDDRPPILIAKGDRKLGELALSYLAASLTERWAQFCVWELLYKEFLRTQEHIDRAAVLIRLSSDRLARIERRFEGSQGVFRRLIDEMADAGGLEYLDQSEGQLLKVKSVVRRRANSLRERLKAYSRRRVVDQGNKTTNNVSISQTSYGSHSPNSVSVSRSAAADVALVSELRQLVESVLSRTDEASVSDRRHLEAAVVAAESGDQEAARSLLSKVGLGTFKYLKEASLPIVSAIVAGVIGVTL